MGERLTNCMQARLTLTVSLVLCIQVKAQSKPFFNANTVLWLPSTIPIKPISIAARKKKKKTARIIWRTNPQHQPENPHGKIYLTCCLGTQTLCFA